MPGPDHEARPARSLLRAAARITEDNDIQVIGSQSILASFDEEELPEPAWMSVEADLAFFDEDQRKPDLVDARIGEDSQFHQRFGMYGQGVDLTSAVLPALVDADVLLARAAQGMPGAIGGIGGITIGDGLTLRGPMAVGAIKPIVTLDGQG